MGIKVLLAEDEEKTRELVKVSLEKEGYQVLAVSTGQEALEKYEAVHLVILDVMMPQGDGWSVCKEIRKNSKVPIIMLTAKAEEADRLTGFELGADDYITKPFSPKELIARVKAVLRRVEGEAIISDESLKFDNLEINTLTRQVICCDQLVNLTPKEFELLYCLAKRPGRVFTREQLLEWLWGFDFYGDVRTVDAHVKNLREKLSQAAPDRKYIHTVWGVGYKFEISIN